MTPGRQAWVVTLVVFLASIAAAANRFKVPPVMQALMADLGVDMATGGWFMSVFALAGLVLAIPTAFLLTRWGLKRAGLIALGCTIVGSTMGALATNPTTFLVSRVIEGVSIGLLGVLSPAAISLWFKPQDRGLPMGIWATWVPVGNVLMFNAAQPLLVSFGWRAVWWFGALLALVAFVLFALFVAAPPKSRSPEDEPLQESPHTFGKRLLNPSSWLLALTFGMFGFSLLGYNTWAPTYLTETLHVDAATASFYASLMFLAAIPGNLVAGWALDRTGNRFHLLAGTFLATGILFAGSFRLGSISIVVPYMLLLGFISNFTPTSIFALAPETMDSLQFAGLGLAIVLVGSYIGSLVGPPLLGSVLSEGNWTVGSTYLVMVMGVGLVALLLAWRRMRTTG